jgi:hypothetical protein
MSKEATAEARRRSPLEVDDIHAMDDRVSHNS